MKGIVILRSHVSMVSKRLLASVAILVGFLAVGACGSPKPAPEIVSSAGFSSYAVAYPSTLEALTRSYHDQSAEARELVSTFVTYPDSLSEPNWKQVLKVAERADEVGRSRFYVEGMRDNGDVSAFFNEEKDEITRRVAGAARSAVKKSECECEVEFSGKIAYALKESVNRQLKERLSGQSDALRLIDRYQVSFGKKNTKVLKEQADAISSASYIVFVQLPDLWMEIDRYVAEATKVGRTIDKALQAEQSFIDSPDITKAQRKAAEKRLTEIEKAKAFLDATVDDARKVAKQAEEEIPTIQKEYEDAFEELSGAIYQRSSE